MTLLRNILLAVTAAAAVAVAPCAQAQLTATGAFTKAPRQVFPMLDNNARLDMVDYFNSGMTTPSTNALKGKSRITALAPLSMTISMTEASDYQLALLPAGSDTIIAVITTVATPAPDSKMALYSKDWTANVTAKTFNKPLLRDWLTADGRKNSDDVESLVPFLLISYSYDPGTAILTLTNNTGSFLSEEIYETVRPYLFSELTYRWDGKKFAPVK